MLDRDRAILAAMAMKNGVGRVTHIFHALARSHNSSSGSCSYHHQDHYACKTAMGGHEKHFACRYRETSNMSKVVVSQMSGRLWAVSVAIAAYCKLAHCFASHRVPLNTVQTVFRCRLIANKWWADHGYGDHGYCLFSECSMLASWPWLFRCQFHTFCASGLRSLWWRGLWLAFSF